LTDATRPSDPSQPAHQAAETTDKQKLERSLKQAFKLTPLHRDLGVELEMTSGGVTLRGEVGQRFARMDGMDTLHGGAVAALLDSGTTLAAVAHTKQRWATADLRIDYLRPVPLGPIEVSAKVLHAGTRISRAQAELHDKSGRLCAVAIATLLAEASDSKS
jgi:uncharacterized protein (TIGR00369 family)